MITDRAGDVARLLLDVGAHRRRAPRVVQERQRTTRIARLGVHSGAEQKRLDVIARSSQQLVRDDARVGGSSEPHERPAFTEHRRAELRLEAPRLAIPLQRFAVRALPREDVSQQRQSARLIGSACHR